jgi:hypothetical protein
MQARIPASVSQETQMKRQLVVQSIVVGMIMACGLAIQPAVAQVRVMATVDGGPGGDPFGGQGRITKASVDGYAKKLKLTEDQKQAALALHEGYDAAVTQANKEFQAGMEDIRKQSDETDDRSVWMEKMPKLRETLNKKTKDLEKSFMSDLQALLTEDQKNSWPAVERQRRRETLLRPGSVSGEGVNLLDIVEGLKLPADAQAKLAEPLNDYETDMDRALLAKQKILDDLPSIDPARGFDMEAFQDRMAKTREAGSKVKEVNQSHERKIEGLLPDDQKTAFEDSVQKATYPSVYRQSRIARSIEAALKFDDLTPGQKDSLTTLKSSYEHDAASANGKWASEIAAAEKKGENGGEMAMPGGGRMQVMFGDDNDDSPLAQARKARRELDDKTKGRLDFMLSKEQKDRLPKDSDPQFRGGPGGAAVRIGG